MPDPGPELLAVEGRSWRLQVWPALGGALVAAHAAKGGEWLAVTRPVSAASLADRDVRKLGGFVLAPFCNRLSGGSFSYGGRLHRVPANWPSDPGTAIHGASWQRPWSVAAHAADRLALSQRVDEEGNAFRYEASLTFDVTGPCAGMLLTVRNVGEETLPFGLGFHPYLRRTPEAWVAFRASGWLEPDVRCYPEAWHPFSEPWGEAEERPVLAFEGVDATFTGWQRTSRVTWPELGAALVIEASETARALHLYVPPREAFLCLEPVSHVIDVVNRRQFAPYGDMIPLAPGGQMAMAMRWRLETLPAR
jgi:aldose 1-epimerase